MFYKLVTIDDMGNVESGPMITSSIWFVCRADSVGEANAIYRIANEGLEAKGIWQEATEDEYFSYLYDSY